MPKSRPAAVACSPSFSGKSQSLPMYEACLVVICSALQLLSGLAWLPLASLRPTTVGPSDSEAGTWSMGGAPNDKGGS